MIENCSFSAPHQSNSFIFTLNIEVVIASDALTALGAAKKYYDRTQGLFRLYKISKEMGSNYFLNPEVQQLDILFQLKCPKHEPINPKIFLAGLDSTIAQWLDLI